MLQLCTKEGLTSFLGTVTGLMPFRARCATSLSTSHLLLLIRWATFLLQPGREGVGVSGMRINLGQAGQLAQTPEGHPETCPT